MKKVLLRCLAYIWVSALAGDLLYLWLGDAWYDPFKFIEYTEVVVLCLMVIFGVSMVVWELVKFDKKLKREKSESLSVNVNR